MSTHLKTSLINLLLFNGFLYTALAVSDDNICDTQCQYCCRNKQCMSQSDCSGNYQPFIIAGSIVGGLIALFVARRLWVWYRNKQRIAQGKEVKKPKKSFLRRRRPGSKSPNKEGKERKEKAKATRSKSGSSKPQSLRETDNERIRNNDEIYLEIGDDGSVLSDDAIKSIKNKNSGKASSRNELKPEVKSESKPGSKNEILGKSDTNLDKEKLNDKDRLNPFKQNKALNDFKPSSGKDKENKKRDDKSKGNSKTPAKKTDNSKMRESSKMKESINSVREKERGRSKEPAAKERANSQKKPSSSGLRNDKSRGNSAGRKYQD